MRRASEELQLPHWFIVAVLDNRIPSEILAGGEWQNTKVELIWQKVSSLYQTVFSMLWIDLAYDRPKGRHVNVPFRNKNDRLYITKIFSNPREWFRSAIGTKLFSDGNFIGLNKKPT